MSHLQLNVNARWTVVRGEFIQGHISDPSSKWIYDVILRDERGNEVRVGFGPRYAKDPMNYSPSFNDANVDREYDDVDIENAVRRATGYFQKFVLNQ